MMFDIRYEIWDSETEKTDDGVMTVEAVNSERAMEFVAHRLEETYEEGSQLLSMELVTYRDSK